VKKIFAQLSGLLLLAFGLTLLLAACGDPTATAPVATTAATTVVATTAPATTAAVSRATAPATKAATTALAVTTVATSSLTTIVAPATTAARATTAAVGTGKPAPKTKIIEPTTDFPRKIEAANGIIEIKQKPQRVVTLSVGDDEMSVHLLDLDRIAAVSEFTADPTISNIPELAAKIPNRIGRNAEQVIAAKPDLVIANPFSNKDLVKQIQDAGITLAAFDLADLNDGYVAEIKVLAYIYGEEQRGETFIKEINAQLARIEAVTARQDASKKPRVLFLQNNAYVSGEGSTGDGIIKRAGGINVASENGISGTKQISLESIIKLNPDYIILGGSPESNPKGFEQLTANPALAEVPAVKNKKFFGIKGTYLSSLSHWTLRGVEELVKILYPGQL